ncbi:hypothetical protein ACXR6G_18445 [Ancylomarina sp. YFZ004]
MAITYLKELKDSDKTALCFRLIKNDKYYNKLLECIDEDESDTMEQFDHKILCKPIVVCLRVSYMCGLQVYTGKVKMEVKMSIHIYMNWSFK